MTTSAPEIYPPSYHVLSPTILKWVPLRAIDIHCLQNHGLYDEGKPIYHLLNHPIKWVRISGVVVAMDEFPERKILTIDDSSGACIECICSVPPPPAAKIQEQNKAKFQVQTHSRGSKAVGKGTDDQPSTQDPKIPWENIDIGSVLRVKAKITTFRDVKQVDVVIVEVTLDSNAEVEFWEKVRVFRREVLSKPWVVGREEGRKCVEREEKGRKVAKSTEREKGKKSENTGREHGNRKADGSKIKRKEEEAGAEKRLRYNANKRRKREAG